LPKLIHMHTLLYFFIDHGPNQTTNYKLFNIPINKVTNNYSKVVTHEQIYIISKYF